MTYMREKFFAKKLDNTFENVNSTDHIYSYKIYISYYQYNGRSEIWLIYLKKTI